MLQLVDRFHLGFLEQLEQWRLEMISKAHETVAGKVCMCTMQDAVTRLTDSFNIVIPTCRVKRLIQN